MLDACSSSNLALLQNLFAASNMPPGSGPVTHQNVTESGPPTADELLLRAVISKQAKIVSFLLQRYPSLRLSQRLELVQAILNNPDADTLQVLCTHDPALASFSIDYHMKSFITDACSRPPEQIVPVLHVLLDNGADVNDGCGPGGGALYAAILGSQPLEIIDKMIQNGAVVSKTVIYAAIEKERPDALHALLKSNQASSRVKPEDLIERAKRTNNEAIVAVVEGLTRERTTEPMMLGERRESKRWWQVWRH